MDKDFQIPLMAEEGTPEYHRLMESKGQLHPLPDPEAAPLPVIEQKPAHTREDVAAQPQGEPTSNFSTALMAAIQLAVDRCVIRRDLPTSELAAEATRVAAWLRVVNELVAVSHTANALLEAERD